MTTVTVEDADEIARRMIPDILHWDRLRLTNLFGEYGIDIQTLTFNEMLAILLALKRELDCGDYPERLKQRIFFAAPLAKPDDDDAADGDQSALADERPSWEVDQDRLDRLGAMARTYQNNTGKLPASIEDIADHWYEMSDRIVVKEHIDEDGRHHPAETVFGVDAPNHCLECIWLRKLEKRSDAEALLAQALGV